MPDVVRGAWPAEKGGCNAATVIYQALRGGRSIGCTGFAGSWGSRSTGCMEFAGSWGSRSTGCMGFAGSRGGCCPRTKGIGRFGTKEEMDCHGNGDRIAAPSMAHVCCHWRLLTLLIGSLLVSEIV